LEEGLELRYELWIGFPQLLLNDILERSICALGGEVIAPRLVSDIRVDGGGKLEQISTKHILYTDGLLTNLGVTDRFRGGSGNSNYLVRG
jgi:hypothetical protein